VIVITEEERAELLEVRRGKDKSTGSEGGRGMGYTLKTKSQQP